MDSSFIKKWMLIFFCVIIQKLFKFDFNFPVLGLSKPENIQSVKSVKSKS